MNDCIFCKIISGEIPSEKLFEDELVTAFRDINPAASTHVLIVPNEHIASTNDLTEAHEPLVGRLFTTAYKLAVAEKIDQSGYRLIINTGPDGGQEVHHLHLHLLGGNRMKHPMG